MFTCLLIVPSWTEACRVWRVLGVRIASRSRMDGDFIDTSAFLSFCIFQMLSHLNKKSLTEKCSRATDKAVCFQELIFQSQFCFYIFKTQHFLSFFVLFFLLFIHFVSTLLRKDKKEITLCRGLQHCGTSSRETFHLVSVLLMTRFRLDICILSFSVR